MTPYGYDKAAGRMTRRSAATDVICDLGLNAISVGKRENDELGWEYTRKRTRRKIMREKLRGKRNFCSMKAAEGKND